ncbi:hypothetical protein KDL01_28435 [Actinospica durhamensis]|uniref:Uncharacterized protein n=1 Tax=Actinospica durhamensis TaxID=1508375 RepID=A0A941IRD5_9ACTN|nr:hypothetical protein [Actinospica durhamensis]MBR7837239.1 hypothetical protein [Actinospica durhamensis]
MAVLVDGLGDVEALGELEAVGVAVGLGSAVALSAWEGDAVPMLCALGTVEP